MHSSHRVIALPAPRPESPLSFAATKLNILGDNPIAWRWRWQWRCWGPPRGSPLGWCVTAAVCVGHNDGQPLQGDASGLCAKCWQNHAQGGGRSTRETPANTRTRSTLSPPIRGGGVCRDTLLISANVDAVGPHEVAPFGPVAPVFAYRDTAHAREGLARGHRSAGNSSMTTYRGRSIPADVGAAAWTDPHPGQPSSRRLATAARSPHSSTAAPADRAAARTWAD